MCSIGRDLEQQRSSATSSILISGVLRLSKDVVGPTITASLRQGRPIDLFPCECDLVAFYLSGLDVPLTVNKCIRPP